jgi:hypothetical protein
MAKISLSLSLSIVRLVAASQSAEEDGVRGGGRRRRDFVVLLSFIFHITKSMTT